MATDCFLAWAKSRLKKKNKEGMRRVWKFTMTRKISWENAEAQGSSVRSQMEDLGMKRPRYDSIKSPDNRSVNIQETCPDDVKKMLIIWSLDRKGRTGQKTRVQ